MTKKSLKCCYIPLCKCKSLSRDERAKSDDALDNSVSQYFPHAYCLPLLLWGYPVLRVCLGPVMTPWLRLCMLLLSCEVPEKSPYLKYHLHERMKWTDFKRPSPGIPVPVNSIKCFPVSAGPEYSVVCRTPHRTRFLLHRCPQVEEHLSQSSLRLCLQLVLSWRLILL